MHYIPVRIGTLRAWEAVNFDIFIKIGERHVHYIKKSDPFDGDRIQSLKTKGVKKLFIPMDSENDYLNYLDSGLDHLKNADLKIEDRAIIAKDSLVTSSENALKNVQTERGYKRTEGQIQKVLDFLTSEQGAMRQILSSSGVAQDTYQHSANVVALSLNLAARCGIKETQTLMNLGLAGLLHDAGKEELGIDTSIPREKMDLAQLTLYQQHCQRAAEKLQDKPYVTKQVLELILNHEEVGEGAGFPSKKRLSTLPKTQQILNLCNEYDRVCTVSGVSPLDAVKQFYVEKLGMFDLELLKLFSESIRA